MCKIKDTLRNLSESELDNFSDIAELDKEEYWIIFYSILKKLSPINICFKLNISESTYFRKLLTAKLKLYYTIKFNK